MEPLTFSLSHTAKPIVRVRFSLYRIKSKRCLFYADRNYGLLPFATLTSLLRSSTKILRTQDTLDSAHPATYICIMSVVAVLGSMSQCAVLPAKTHWPADSEDQAEVWGQSSRLACARFHTQPTGGGSRTLQGCPAVIYCCSPHFSSVSQSTCRMAAYRGEGAFAVFLCRSTKRAVRFSN